MAKTKVQLQDVSDMLSNLSEPFQAPALIAAPNTTITDLSGNARKLADPSKTIRPAMGIERIHTKSIKLVPNEKGPAGQQVWQLDNGDDRIRFVGDWSSIASGDGTFPFTTAASDYVEITFYGDKLNLVTVVRNVARDIRVVVDGGAPSGNIYTTGSDVLYNRNYGANQIITASSSTLGVHTVKLTNFTGGNTFPVLGFEILNEASTIKIPQGRILGSGKSATINSLQSLDYNTGFDGSPTLNGRGGRVVIYSDGSQIKKAIQQVDASQLNLTAADHANEEVIRRINFREFGANRADDFSTLSATSNRAFTLDDGTTTLLGLNVNAATPIAGADCLAMPNVSTNFITLTFVGTGLDIVTATTLSTWTFSSVVIDGIAVGSLTPGVNAALKINKVVSGLPYGTHTVKFFADNTVTATITDFIIYGPKKPSIPADAVEIGEYYLMANFVANATTSAEARSTGVLRKVSSREHTYVGTWTLPAISTLNLSGFTPFTGTISSYTQYTFFGTGLDYRFSSNSVAGTFVITLTDLANPAGTSNLSGFTTSSYGAGIASFTASTGTIVTNVTGTNNMGVVISGLALGWHTIKITKTAGTGQIYIDAADIITPIHFPDTKRGSLALKPAIEVKQLAKESNVDLSKAKAWVSFDGPNSTINSANNISSVLKTATGTYLISFEKPFKNASYIAVGTSDTTGSTTVVTKQVAGNKRANSILVYTRSSSTDALIDASFDYTFFGELADEEYE
jgi:hypothetical protein